MDLRKDKKTKYTKGALAILGAIILGALGSGLWDMIFKPGLSSGRDLLLNIVSFGMNSIKDRTYSQIARGFHEEPSINLLFFVVLAVVCAVGYLIFDDFAMIKKLKRAHMELIRRMDTLATQEQKPKPPEKVEPHEPRVAVDDLRKLAATISIKRYRHSAYIWAILSIIVLSGFVADYIRFSYANSAITHFHQAYSIASPFIDEHNHQEIFSSFAQIKKREDYIRIIEYLKSVAEQNNQKVPAFSAW